MSAPAELALDAFARALTGLTTGELRDLIHDTRRGVAVYVHAINVELLHRIQTEELIAFQARLAGATDEQIQDAARQWCCPGELAAAHRHVVDEEQEWRIANQHTGGAQ